MFTKQEKIAIARVFSDMIKADNIIEESEIDMLNKIKREYGIDSQILVRARQIKFSDAVNILVNLPNADKENLFKALRTMALVDGVCVPYEAMLLLAMSYAFGLSLDRNKSINNIKPEVKLMSCPSNDASLNKQYVVFIEGRNHQKINEEISSNLERNVLKLRQWGFDFIYIPTLVQEFGAMNEGYVKDVIRYMAPELSINTIDVVYDRLLKMDTITFCNQVLATNLGVKEVKNAEPSLLINIGSSVVPYCSVSGPVECYTEFLSIPIGDNFTQVVDDFLSSYSKIVSYYIQSNPVFPHPGKRNFKYFGFYKAMFDFLVKAEPVESDIIIQTMSNNLVFPQFPSESLGLSPQEAAIYKLILECTYNDELGGLPTSTTINSYKCSNRIESLYAKIYQGRNRVMPDNMAPIISRITAKLRSHLRGLSNLEDFIPSLCNGKYRICARPERVKIRASRDDIPAFFVGYTW